VRLWSYNKFSEKFMAYINFIEIYIKALRTIKYNLSNIIMQLTLRYRQIFKT